MEEQCPVCGSGRYAPERRSGDGWYCVECGAEWTDGCAGDPVNPLVGDMTIVLHRSRQPGPRPPRRNQASISNNPETHWLYVDGSWYLLPHRSVFKARGDLMTCLEVLGAVKWEGE